MNAELVFFGKRVDMAQRHRRRILVITVYAVLAVFLASVWRLTHWHSSGVWVFWATILACRFFLGGYYSGGLIKPFRERDANRYERAPSLLMLKLRVYQPVPGEGESYRNDERELGQRDHAHYLAYQALGGAIVLFWLFASLRNEVPSVTAWMTMAPDELYCGIAMTAMTLFLTLPQVILLWTEPDMDAD